MSSIRIEINIEFMKYFICKVYECAMHVVGLNSVVFYIFQFIANNGHLKPDHIRCTIQTLRNNY